jgi:hypothetical protein
MPKDNHFAPRQYLGVMVSSTFTDLEQHRAALIKAIKGQGLTDVAMENDSAKPDVDVIESSLQMVRDAAAYVGVISHKYGQTPLCPERNPGALSITELEFNEAQRLDRPILLFIMGDKHQVLPADVETDAPKREMLNAFRERAKRMKRDSPVHRVYATFDSPEQFAARANQAVADLRRYLDDKATTSPPAPPAPSAIPHAHQSRARPHSHTSAFYAEPPYIGSHKFVGRETQLDVLSDWAVFADPHPVLLFDAIGGSGKSMLSWEWTTLHATQVRGDWAGRFWYSFYERGARRNDAVLAPGACRVHPPRGTRGLRRPARPAALGARGAEAHIRMGDPSGARPARPSPYAPAFLREPSPRVLGRSARRPGASGPRRHRHHPGLHPPRLPTPGQGLRRDPPEGRPNARPKRREARPRRPGRAPDGSRVACPPSRIAACVAPGDKAQNSGDQ